MKRVMPLLLAACLICMQSTLMANIFSGPFSGLFAGVSVGVATNSLESTSTTLFNPNIDVQSTIFSGDNAYQIRPLGEVFGGLGVQFCRFYLGARAGANFTRYDPTVKSEDNLILFASDDSLKIDASKLQGKLRIAEYTVDLKPGLVFFQNTLLYGLAGIAFNHKSLKGISPLQFNESGGGITTNLISETVSKHARGWRGGVGIEHLFWHCMSVNLSYVFTYYWDLDLSASSATLPAIVEHTLLMKSKTYKQLTSIGLTYYF